MKSTFGFDDPQLFDFTEAQAEALVQPKGMAVDLRGKPITAVAERVSLHGPSLPNPG